MTGKIDTTDQSNLILLRPRMDTVDVTQGRTALITDTDGLFLPGK